MCIWFLFLLYKNLLRVSWSPDGQFLSAGSADKFLYIWDYEETKIAYKLPGHQGSVNDVAFHPLEPIGKKISRMNLTSLNLEINLFILLKWPRLQVTRKFSWESYRI